MDGPLRASAIILSVVALGALAASCGDSSAGGVTVGDCIVEPQQGSASGDMANQPCSGPHDAEVFAVLTHPAGAGEPFPADDGFSDYVQENCVPLWEIYTDRTWGADPELAIGFLAPTGTSWAAGDRQVVCYTTRYGGGPLTGSVKDIGASPLPAASP